MGNLRQVLVTTLALTALNSSCLADVSEATHILQGNAVYSPIDESHVTVFVTKPDFQFNVIGTIEARGMAEGGLGAILDVLTLSSPSEKQDLELAMSALKSEAASIGANGVVIVRQGQVRVSKKATERRIVGVAIRY